MTLRASPLLLLFGCYTGPSTGTTDTGDTQVVTDPGPDTGTAFIMWHGSLKYDADAESLTAERGLGARTLSDKQYLCDIYAEYTSVGPGAHGCPDCEYSFTVQLTGGDRRGDGCRDFLRPTIFSYYNYTDFYFGTELDGFGWSQEYIYTYTTINYLLTDVVWGHVNGSRYNGWFLYGYNFPSSASYNVAGDKYDATFERPLMNQTTGTLAYYYFYY